MKKIIKLLIASFKKIRTKISVFSVLRETFCEENVSIRPLAKLERSNIGKCTSIGSLAAIYDSEVGRFCNIARECYIGGASHPLNYVSTSACFYLKDNFTGVCYNEKNYEWKTKTKIGNDVWLGNRVIVIGGVSIGDGAVIGAGSVVTKDVPPYEVWAGNPARFIKKRFDDETIDKLLKIKWWEMKDDQLLKYGSLFSDVLCFIERIEEKTEL